MTVQEVLAATKIRQRSKRNGSLNEWVDFWTIPEPNSGCLLWFGTVGYKDYPKIRWRGASRPVARLLWEQNKGPIPANYYLCHKCDVPCCLNQDHHFLGTQRENMADMYAKNRGNKARGEKNGFAKLTEDAVRAILASTELGCVLAERFDVSESAVSRVRLRQTWRHIPVLQ